MKDQIRHRNEKKNETSFTPNHKMLLLRSAFCVKVISVQDVTGRSLVQVNVPPKIQQKSGVFD